MMRNHKAVGWKVSFRLGKERNFKMKAKPNREGLEGVKKFGKNSKIMGSGRDRCISSNWGAIKECRGVEKRAGFCIYNPSLEQQISSLSFSLPHIKKKKKKGN